MNYDLIKEKLDEIFLECNTHIKRLDEAKTDMKSFMPLEEITYKTLSKENIRTIDQFLFRFAKLQDAIGDKLFKTLLIYLNENIDGFSMLDILNKLEKLNILENSNEWKTLRTVRNDISHSYENDYKKIVIQINNIFKYEDVLEKIYYKILDYYSNI